MNSYWTLTVCRLSPPLTPFPTSFSWNGEEWNNSDEMEWNEKKNKQKGFIIIRMRIILDRYTVRSSNGLLSEIAGLPRIVYLLSNLLTKKNRVHVTGASAPPPRLYFACLFRILLYENHFNVLNHVWTIPVSFFLLSLIWGPSFEKSYFQELFCENRQRCKRSANGRRIGLTHTSALELASEKSSAAGEIRRPVFSHLPFIYFPTKILETQYRYDHPQHLHFRSARCSHLLRWMESQKAIGHDPWRGRSDMRHRKRSVTISLQTKRNSISSTITSTSFQGASTGLLGL